MTEKTVNHFVDIKSVSKETLRLIIKTAREVKHSFKNGQSSELLKGKQLALIFEKPSTRTRVSFEVGINQLGGQAVLLNSHDSQLGRGETVADTARVLSRYVDIIMLRTFRHDVLLEMAEHATVPVINGLTDNGHPCQVMTDIMTFEEHKGSIEGKTIAWVGDCNNMASSWIEAAEKFGFTLRIGCPDEFSPAGELPSCVTRFLDAKEAVKGADCVTTDTWVSMGDKEANYRKEVLAPYQVNDALMALANPDAIFLHCLPAHREEEVTSSVMDGAQSVVFDEAENRLHLQKAVMLWCLNSLALPHTNGNSNKAAA